MIEARDISVEIGSRTIVSIDRFTAQPGQLTAIVGPNGSGKTTLMKALSGDISYSGRVTLNGHDLASRSTWRLARERAVLPQSTTLSFPFTVREVVELGLLDGPGLRRDEDRAAQALAAVDLTGFAGRFYQELSGGEQQRVQLARVLCQVWDPVAEDGLRYLLLDEPVSSLDISHQLTIMRLARQFADRGGGVVAIMHDLNLTAMFADRVAILSGGRCIASGTPADVFNEDILERAFDCRLRVNAVPGNNIPFVLPQAAA